MRNAASAEVAELGARLRAFQDETSRAAAQNERRHREQVEHLEAELLAARDLAAQGGSEISDANRSRDAAIDELARQRTEIDKLRSELGGAHADVNRLKEEHEAAIGTARQDSDQDVVRLDALTKCELVGRY